MKGDRGREKERDQQYKGDRRLGNSYLRIFFIN